MIALLLLIAYIAVLIFSVYNLIRSLQAGNAANAFLWGAILIITLTLFGNR